MRFLAGIALATLLQGLVLSEGLMARHQSRVEGLARTPDIHFSPTRHNIADAMLKLANVTGDENRKP